MNYNTSSGINSNCPVMSQSDWDNAPWNEDVSKPRKVEVTVSMTLSKTVEIEVSDYTVEKGVDEEGFPITHLDFSECDLKQAVKDQITLPDEAYDKLHHAVYYTEDYSAQERLEDLKDWNVDDFEVVLG
ncbi:MAG TPA: hypothetical protein DCW90_11330 [Lachnospiraceae bacterium]|nr:hypothetical protein [Lachnospiraceae bacterium]